MAEITEYEYRLSQALERLSKWADRYEAQGGAQGGAGDSDAALEAERAANVQLRARVDELSARQSEVIARLEADLAAVRAECDALRAAATARDAAIDELAGGLESWLDEAQDKGGDHA